MKKYVIEKICKNLYNCDYLTLLAIENYTETICANKKLNFLDFIFHPKNREMERSQDERTNN